MSEKTVKPRGVKKGQTPQWKVGRKAGVSVKPAEEKKTATFFGCRFTKERAEELREIFENYKKRNGLTTTQAIEKIILEKK